MEKHGRIYKGFYIAPEQWLQLRIMSAIQKENVSVTLRRIIKEFLDRNQDQIKGGIEKNVNICIESDPTKTKLLGYEKH